MVFFLLFAGAMVTSHDAGLSVPDWPSTYGYNMFLYPVEKWVGGIFYEHSHRLVASVTGLLILILAVWLALAEKRPLVRRLGFISLGAVIIQGTLGGLTVIMMLPPIISASHGTLGQTILLLTLLIAYSQSREWNEGGMKAGSTPMFRSSVILLTLVFVQLMLGAAVRHTRSGLSIPDFPTMGGYYFPYLGEGMLAGVNSLRASLGLPDVAHFQIILQILHRLMGLGIAFYAVAVVIKTIKSYGVERRICRTALFLGAVVLSQFTLGAITVLSRREPLLTSLHVITGALLLATAAFLAMRLYRAER